MKILPPNETAQLQQEIARLKTEISAFKSQLDVAQKKINYYEEQLRLIRQRHWGKKAETSASLQFVLFDESESDEVIETVEPIDDKREQVTYRRAKRQKSKGRNLDTSKLPREQRFHDLVEEQKICSCGCALEKIGEDVSEQLEYIPEVIKVIEHIQPKYTCRQCETIQSAKKPEQPLQKSMASSSLIAEVILKKYDHHLPLYRQSQILAQRGIEIPDNTLGNWVMESAALLTPLEKAFWDEFQRIRLAQADETPVKILHPDQKAFMWAYQSLDPGNRFIIFDFQLTRSGEHPSQRLAEFQGILQTDGYSGYNELRQRAGVVSAGCWDHARRKFKEAIQVSNKNMTGIGGQLFQFINKLYKIEQNYKAASIEERYQARQQYAKPILKQIFEKAKNAKALPKSALNKAITYLINQEDELMRYIHYGDVPISNCLTENQIRPFAIGRKNWLFVGNETSARKSALWYSLIQSCKINQINPRNYLVTVLNRVHAMRRGEVNPRDLLPQFIDQSLLA